MIVMCDGKMKDMVCGCSERLLIEVASLPPFCGGRQRPIKIKETFTTMVWLPKLATELWW